MGSEDLFHKRKARKAEDSIRKKSKRQPYDRVLIVTEGLKTEPLYFEEIRVALELDSANIEIDGNCGSSPISVVNHAYYLYQQELASGDCYNRVYCVFDKDSHSTFTQAIRRVNCINQQLRADKLDDQTKFKAIISVPSFEYWLLIHYNPTTRPYVRTPTKSIGDLVINDLKFFVPDYKKNQKGFYKRSLDEGTLEGALANSKRIYEEAKHANNNSSYTNIHELVIYLQNLKSMGSD